MSLILINIYQQYIRIMLPCACRFQPTCSEYTKEAISKYGFLGGTLRGLRRVLSCHPFSKRSGYDPLL